MGKCYYHPEEEAVGQCSVCGKNLCRDCFNLTEGHICYECAQKLNAQRKREFLVSLIVAIVVVIAWIVGLVLIENENNWGFLILFIVGFIPAWRALSTDSKNLIVVSNDFVIGYYVAKIVLACLFAIFMLPIAIIKLIVYLVRFIKETKNYKIIEENQAQLMRKENSINE